MRSISLLGALALVSTVAGRRMQRQHQPPTGDAGSVALALQAAPGVTINVVSYTISGPELVLEDRTIDVSHSSTVSTTIGGFPAGSGFAVTLTGSSTDGATTCGGGPVSFTVVAGQTIPVSVHLLCHEAPRTGSVIVNGTLNICPSIDNVSASPSEVFVGGSVALTASAHDSDAGPSALTFQWTASSGVISHPSAASTSFTVHDAGHRHHHPVRVRRRPRRLLRGHQLDHHHLHRGDLRRRQPVHDRHARRRRHLRARAARERQPMHQRQPAREAARLQRLPRPARRRHDGSRNRPVGGAGVFVSYLRAAQAGIEDQTIIVNAGDRVGASPPDSALLQDEPSIQMMNLLANSSCSYTDKMNPACNIVGTLGNHEFDEGQRRAAPPAQRRQLPERAVPPRIPYQGARFPYVSANVSRRHQRHDRCSRRWSSSRSHGVPIAFIGAVLEQTPTIVTPTGVAGLTFLDEADAINSYVPGLKAMGVHTIVVTIHQGGFQTSYNGPTNPTATLSSGPEILDIVNRLDDEIDVVVSGHTHAFTNALIPNAHGKPILVTQAFSASTAYDDIDLLIDPVTQGRRRRRRPRSSPRSATPAQA